MFTNLLLLILLSCCSNISHCCVSIPLIALLEELYKESRGGAQDGPVRKSSAATE
jgi:hypothetical protein